MRTAIELTMKYSIISTGSIGNAVVIDDFILIDCGVPFKALKKVYKKLKLVLLTHVHSDHFCKRTIKKLASERPTLYFACCEWLIRPLLDCGVPKQKILPLKLGEMYDLGACEVSPVWLYHDVPNAGYRIYIGDEKALYITDTGHLNGISAKDYDLYMIEANYTEEDLKERLNSKREAGEYAYEENVASRHLSKEQADEFLLKNMGIRSRYVYLHEHTE